ncbi:putative mitochondrial protein AtMg00310 [Primulina tabacum]|uniref:putative mitochondrial protein AtMg00310 n=1 Tax=Primulina tabacum TaxID=48773 RepID=UPI003F5A397F
MVNVEKSALTFSPSTSSQDIDSIRQTLTIPVVKGHDLYLGLPTFSLRKKRIQFDYLRERVLKKSQSWNSNFFSMGGREVLIKAVLQAIPTYAMSCFKLPITLCRNIEQVFAKFWWNAHMVIKKKRMHWAKWDKMCLRKRVGSMGFRNLSAFKKALLAKQVWRIIQYPNSLLERVLKSRYFRSKDIMLTDLGTRPSFVWRYLIWGRDLLEKGCAGELGMEILYWHIKIIGSRLCLQAGAVTPRFCLPVLQWHGLFKMGFGMNMK